MSRVTQAQQAINAGNFRLAQDVLARQLRDTPHDLDSLYLSGICEQARGNADMAAQQYQRVLALKSDHFGAHYNMGLLLSEQGKDREALPHHTAAVCLQPAQPWAWINRGNALARLGQHKPATEDYAKALELAPQIPEAHTNLGNALRETGELDASLGAHDTAIRLNPGLSDAWANKSTTLIALRQYNEAMLAAEKAIQLRPGSAHAWVVRGSVLRALRHWQEALQSLDHALRLQPEFVDAWHNRGIVLGDMGQQELALASFDHALAINPEFAPAWFYRGSTLAIMKSPLDALRSFEKALALAPQLDRLRGAYLLAKMSACDWTYIDAHIAALRADIQIGRSVGTPLGLACLLDDPAELAQVATAFTESLHPSRSAPTTPRRGRSDGKIRVAYYSADFRTHPVGQLLVELLEKHDRSRFEVIGFSLAPAINDPLRERIAHAFDRFVDVGEKSDADVVQMSREMGVDIAVNLGGHTEGARTDIFAMRSAPVQASYLGYPGTMGATYMDYLITDQFVCPHELRECYTEKVAYLPDCFMPHDSTQVISPKIFQRKDFDLPENGFVFCCFNNHYKLTPQMFDIWMRLLLKTPGSVLWLSSANDLVQSNLAREARARGVDPDRLIYARRIESMSEHLARYSLADLFLDTLPYNAHTTACDALWAGVPVLTCPGRTFASRVAASLLHTAQLPELVTDTLLGYEARALELAQNPQQLKSIKRRLSEIRLESPLFDTPRLTVALEDLYSRMMERVRSGLAPTHLLCQPGLVK